MQYTFKEKIFCLLIICLFVLSSASELFAQRRNRQVVSIGPKIGANLTSLHGDVSNQTLQPGLSAGAILTYSVVNTFGISVEALYSQKGAKFENALVPGSATQRMNFNRRLNYVEVPLLARYFLNKDGDFRPNVFVGPNFGFKLNAKDVNRSMVGGTAQPDTEISSVINPVDVGITGGIGLNLRLQSAMRVLLDVRYTYGISNITDSQIAGFTVANPTVGNNAITITAGLSFGIGKKYEK
jgi:outer membrane protein W